MYRSGHIVQGFNFLVSKVPIPDSVSFTVIKSVRGIKDQIECRGLEFNRGYKDLVVLSIMNIYGFLIPDSHITVSFAEYGSMIF